MFDITPNDINQLNDVDLRELVGRLCEAELADRGLSPSAVTYGGNQTAADGGLDVRVSLPTGVSIEGFVPRTSTGFQVKKPDMPRADIIAEMRPSGTIRPVIQELADEAGAYVIVSSAGSTADIALRNRQNALREALTGVNNADQLYTDFYDRTRLATWVRRHPGVITWVKEKVGRTLVGWRPYGPWAGTAEGGDAEYLLDDKLRLHLGRNRGEPAHSVADVIDQLRDELSQPGKVLRLVGLSGVGKTRLAQVLFDPQIGARPLPSSLAVYTNLSDDPDPQPIGMASDLIENRMRAVLIVDNCPPELHSRLSELCRGRASTVSLLTIEYDVRGDQPEGTQVVTLDTSSLELIETLVRRRYPHISRVDAHTIAEVSGGNARIAIAIAETVGHSDSIAGFTNDELFQRLFRQRHGTNEALHLAAQACSLVYSFDGETFDGAEAELPRLASLVGQTPTETYRYVGEMLRRNLVQQRGVWRAVLPHALANHLAARALEDIPYERISQQLVDGGGERLTRSFSRRLSFLHDHPKAIAIVDRWLAPDGILGDLAALNDLKRAMFENAAPVLPGAALAALERVGDGPSEVATKVWQRHLSLLRSLAYDAPLFERTCQILARASVESMDELAANQANEAFVSLFTIYLSGTHASIEQRLGVLERLLMSGEAKSLDLGLAAMGNLLEAKHFSSSYQFEFGARLRNFGYKPRSAVDVSLWYGATFEFIERLAFVAGLLKQELGGLLAKKFSGLWTVVGSYAALERLFRRFAADGFWREGWFACREVMHHYKDQMPPDAAALLYALEADLRPSNLSERVRAIVLCDWSNVLYLQDVDVDTLTSESETVDAIAYELGVSVATEDEVFEEILPDLLRGGSRVWVFGRGLAGASTNLRATWTRLVEELDRIQPEQRDAQVFRGILAELWEKDRGLAQDLLDSALEHPILVTFLPLFHSGVGLDERGVERLKIALDLAKIPVHMCHNLALGRTTDGLEGDALKDLVLLIADLPNGFDVALHILQMRLYSDRLHHQESCPELLEAGRDLLQRITFRNHNRNENFYIAEIVMASLTAPGTGSVAAAIADRLRQAVAAGEAYPWNYHGLLVSLLKKHPTSVLNALFCGNAQDQQAGIRVFDHIDNHQRNPANSISCEALIDWCNGDSERRYVLAASIITFAHRPEENGPQVWSEQAKSLLTNAPDMRSVLMVLIERFIPMSWSGSRAALIESNAQLLENLDSLVPSNLIPFLTAAKAKLSEDVARVRQWETRDDRERDERFE